jgi:hypothetical protein
MNAQTSTDELAAPSTGPGGKVASSDQEPDGTEVWAVCCSGGGIRSASYCLGALQALEEGGFLKKTKLILGVSGGSYIAASRALVARNLELGAGDADTNELPAYAPGSPEEQHLRDNTRYIAPDAKTLLAGVLSLLFGAAVNLVLVLTPVFAVAHAWGWVLRSRRVLNYTVMVAGHSRTQQWTATLTATSWWIWPVIAAGVTFVIFGWWWVTLRPGPLGQERQSQVAVKALGWAAFITVVLATAMFAVPGLVTWLSSSHSGALRTVLDDLGFGSGAGWTPAAIGGFVAAVVAVSQSARNTLTKYDLLRTPEAAQGSAPQPGLIGTAVGYLRGLLLPWLASVLVLFAFAVAGLRWAKDGAAAGFTSGQVWQVIGALAVMLVMRFLADANRISLHDYYRWRLASAYSVIRDTIRHEGKPGPFGTIDFPGALLSGLSGQQPKLVLCTTANINAHREVPPGRAGLSFSFDPDHATLRGPGPTESVQARTTDYEALVGPYWFTLFDVSAISGAAFSPLMGAATRQAYRILFTATNLRLGVWLPHPAVVQAARQELDDQDDEHKPDHRSDRWWHALGLLLWYVVPHPLWQRGDEARERREARLWAYVLKLRSRGSRSQRFFGGLLYHALQPTLGMLYAEAAGHTSYRDTWMCVTDGGHYDNLGLVEALKRAPALGVTHLLVLDASGDKADTWSTLGGSIALARSDAETEIVINPMRMITPPKSSAPKLGSGQVVRPWASGTFTQAPAGTGRDRTLVVCKLGWWTGAPWDVRAYAAGHPAYPADSTAEQLYDSAEFDAYRELGACSVKLALHESMPVAAAALRWRVSPEQDEREKQP